MRKIFIVILTTLFSAAAVAQTGGIEVSQAAMRSSDDTLTITMAVTVHPDAVSKLQGMAVVPVLSGGSGEIVRFPAVVVNGRNRARIYARHAKFRYREIVGNPPYRVVDLNRKFTGATLAYSAQIAAEPWMERASLNLEYVLISPAGERRSYAVPVSGISATAALPEPVAASVQVASGGVGTAEQASVAKPSGKPAETGVVRTVSGTARLEFAAASHALTLDGEHNRRELAGVDSAIGRIIADPDTRIVSVTITGYSSPDGYYNTNVSLAHDRGTAFSHLLQERYDLPAGAIKIRAVGENWSDLRSAIAEGEMPHRNEILSVVDSADPPDAKESRLRRMASGEVWKRLEREIFPHLRKVDYSIDYRSAE